jgi:dTDP-4-amino-4,6-dideoxygalactose transaminase
MTIQLFSPSITESDIAAVSATMRSGWLGKGPKVTEFERLFAEYIGVNPANVVSINSCTEALFLACEMLGIGPGDEVIIPSIHFVGAANAILSTGARPVFCDVDSRTLNATVNDIAFGYTDKTKAVIINHYGGIPCDILNIKRWCYTWQIKLIEDSACSLGAALNGQHCGTFGDIGVWSFDAMKLITTGDGGMVYFADEAMAQEARLRTYLGQDTATGLSSDKAQWWEFEVKQPGRRSIMNDIAASLGIEQLGRIDEFIERRRDICAHYHNGLEDTTAITLPEIWLWGTGKKTSLYFYWIQTSRRDELAQFLRANGIYTSFRYYPLHWAFKTGDSLPGAERAVRETLLLPLHCNLTDSDVKYVCGKVREFYK